MKLLYTLAALMLFSFVNAQIVNIPDAEFKFDLLYSNYVAQNAAGNSITVDWNHDGEIQVSEALLVAKLSFYNSGVNSFEGIQAFTNLVEFSCDNNWIQTLDVSMLPALKKLSCNSCGLTTLNVNGLLQLEELRTNNNYLTTLNMGNLPALKIFECEHNQFVTIDLTNLTNIQKLDCYGNDLTTVNLSNLTNLTDATFTGNMLTAINTVNLPNLKNFSIGQNQLTSFDISNLPAIEVFGCESNPITSLNVTGAVTLKNLSCAGCQLANLDVSTLTGLNLLYCEGNQLTTLDVSNLVNLNGLVCEYNQLTSINFGDIENITYLYCTGNSLTSLDLGNFDAMINLRCASNQLQTIDVSNMPELYMLFCNNNQLQTLDLSGNYGLNFLDCSVNQLVTIYAKNGYQESGFDFSGNQTLQFICVDESQVAGVTQLMYNFSWPENFSYVDHCALSSYCSLAPGGDYYELQGNTAIDMDNDGCEASDAIYPALNLTITNGTITGNFIANNSGAYYIPVQPGLHTITPQLENPDYFAVSPLSYQVDFPTQSSPQTHDFCVTFNGAHQDLEVIVAPMGPARPGFDNKYRIIYKNKGTTPETGTISFLFEDDKMDFVSATPVQSSLTTNVVGWDYINLQPFETRSIDVTFNANSPAETPAVNTGDQLNFQATINSVADDETPLDNIFGFKQFVVGSFDPNDKTCLEGQVVGPEIAGNYVHYIIRFENTGNYQAENVIVKDYIDTNKFDINSLIPISGSHQFVTRISNSNLVEFIFEGINLPFEDSANDGYVVFKIKTLPTLGEGSTFSNSARIFFDYNLPVATNMATTTIQSLGDVDFEFAEHLTIYPNPSDDVLNIAPDPDVTLASVNIFNSLGQLVMTVGNPQSAIEVSTLQSGTYFIKAITDKGVGISTFIKK
jgi:hypothetical protein